ncbi:MAG: Calx-beta domain-containing protein [Pseudomonadota bacterium]
MAKYNDKSRIPNRHLAQKPLVLAIGSVLALSVSTTQAATITVTAGAVDIINNGNCSLLEAIITAELGTPRDSCVTGAGGAGPAGADTIVLPASSTFALTAPYGSDNGLPGIASTMTIQGNGSTIMRSSGSDFRIMNVTVSGDVTLENTTLSGGYITAPGIGGGINNGGNLTLDNSTVSNNESYYGGGIYNSSSGILTITNGSSVSNNRVRFAGTVKGAGIFNGGALIISDSTISGNSASSSPGSYGGGIFHAGSPNMTITNSMITGNSSFGGSFSFGGGIIADVGSGMVTINNSTVSLNVAGPGATGTRGGGLILNTATSITNSTISGNSAGFSGTNGSGGGISSGGVPINIASSTISGNFARAEGGGISISMASSSTINNSTISGNSAGGYGGGIYKFSGRFYLNNTTIANNTSTLGAGGFHHTSGRSYAYQSIIANNATVSGAFADCIYPGATAFTSGTSLIEDGNCGTPALTGDPNLGALGNNGGLTQTHELLSGSVAINPGLGACPAGLIVDQRGTARDADCDLGAYEYVPPPPPQTLTTIVNGMGTLSSNPMGIDCPTDCSAPYAIGTLVTLTATPAAGWQFDSWGDACAGNTNPTPTSVALSADLTCSVTFTEIPIPGEVGFAQTNYSVNEADGSISIEVARSGQGDGPASIDYTLSAGTATAGADYTDTSGTLNWTDMELGPKTFDIVIPDDMTLETDETVTLTLSNPTPASLGVMTETATLTIVDDEVPPDPGSVGFTQTSYSVNEADGSITIGVVRGGTGEGPASIDYALSAGTATAGADYTDTSGTLTWGDMEFGQQTFDILIADDPDAEPDETVTLILSNPAPTSLGGTSSSATLTIMDNPDTLQFVSTDASLIEDEGEISLTLSRMGDGNGAVSVTVTASGSATNNIDYALGADQVSWGEGDLSDKTLTFTVIDDVIAEPEETVILNLSDPAGEATIGSNASLQITLIDDFSPDITDVTPDNAMDFNAEQLAQIEPAALMDLDSGTVMQIPADAFQGLTPMQFEVLPLPAIQAITPAQFNRIPSSALMNANANQLEVLDLEVVNVFDAEDLMALPENVFEDTPTRTTCRFMVHLDAAEVTPTDVNPLLIPTNIDVDLSTGAFSVPAGDQICLRSLPPQMLPDNLDLPDDIPDLSSSFALGGEGGEPVLDGIDAALTEAGGDGLMFMQNGAGVLNVVGNIEGFDFNLAFTIETGQLRQAEPGSTPGVAFNDENQFIIITREEEIIPLVPAPQDPFVLVDALGNDNTVSIGELGDVIIRQPNDEELVVLFGFEVIPAPPELGPGIHLFPNTQRMAQPLGLVVYGNGTAQQIFPYIPDPDSFAQTALALSPLIEFVKFNLLDGTAQVRFSGFDFVLIPQTTSAIRQLATGEIVIPSILVNPDQTLNYSVGDNNEELLTNIIITLGQ